MSNPGLALVASAASCSVVVWYFAMNNWWCSGSFATHSRVWGYRLVDFGPGVVRRPKAAVLDRGITALDPRPGCVALRRCREHNMRPESSHSTGCICQHRGGEGPGLLARGAWANS